MLTIRTKTDRIICDGTRDPLFRRTVTKFGEKSISCDSCQLVFINGMMCHELGCPEAWKDETVECFQCGVEFHPEERGQRTCPGCIHDMENRYVEEEAAE